MKRSRVHDRCAAGGTLLFTLAVLSGCGSTVSSLDGGSDGAVQPTTTALCERNGWCPALPTDFATPPMLVGDQVLAHAIDGRRMFVRRPEGWQSIDCPADADADAPATVLAGMTSDTVVRCAARTYRWGSAGLSPLPAPPHGVRTDMPSFALPAVIFYETINELGESFLTRCSAASCDSFELRSLSGVVPREIFATSADNFGVVADSRAFRRTQTGWSEVPIDSVARPPAWPPTANATCLANDRWVPCGSDPAAIGPFLAVQRTSSRVLLRGRFDEHVVYDGARTQRLQSTSLASFRRQHWPELDADPMASRLQWVYPSSVDGALDRGVERLFMTFVAAVPAEGTGGPRAARTRVFTRLGDGAWSAVGDDLGPCDQVSATSLDNVWVRCNDDRVLHFDGRAWSAIAVPAVLGVCALSDGSAIVHQQSNAAVSRLRVGEPPSQTRAANKLLGCTHDDVFAIDASGVIFHRAEGAWQDVVAPPVPAAQRALGTSDFGITVWNPAMREAFVWDGAQWQPRNEAIESFEHRGHRVRFASSEWAAMGFAPGALMVRTRR